MSINKLETLEVSGTPEEIGFAVGNNMADSIRETVLPLGEFQQSQRNWKGSSYLKKLDEAARKRRSQLLQYRRCFGGRIVYCK